MPRTPQISALPSVTPLGITPTLPTPLTDALADAAVDDIYPACEFCGEPIDYCLGGHEWDPAERDDTLSFDKYEVQA